ncbi:MAG: hypothetical protein NC250_01850 [Alistipes senegalensis]|nr:hypothetical protein [Bacteroides cellulosilyticus]MCM1351461.1 hypothetical protein [Alistipes senegalensis]
MNRHKIKRFLLFELFLTIEAAVYSEVSTHFTLYGNYWQCMLLWLSCILTGGTIAYWRRKQASWAIFALKIAGYTTLVYVPFQIVIGNHILAGDPDRVAGIALSLLLGLEVLMPIYLIFAHITAYVFCKTQSAGADGTPENTPKENNL